MWLGVCPWWNHTHLCHANLTWRNGLVSFATCWGYDVDDVCQRPRSSPPSHECTGPDGSNLGQVTLSVVADTWDGACARLSHAFHKTPAP